ncbi:hypothetical protein L9F63_025367, partial [Diploptera punctata]
KAANSKPEKRGECSTILVLFKHTSGLIIASVASSTRKVSRANSYATHIFVILK